MSGFSKASGNCQPNYAGTNDDYIIIFFQDIPNFYLSMVKVEKMIMPLLYNLMKNPEDIYIKWPNRKEIIQKQINRIVAITRGV